MFLKRSKFHISLRYSEPLIDKIVINLLNIVVIKIISLRIIHFDGPLELSRSIKVVHSCIIPQTTV